MNANERDVVKRLVKYFEAVISGDIIESEKWCDTIAEARALLEVPAKQRCVVCEACIHRKC